MILSSRIHQWVMDTQHVINSQFSNGTNVVNAIDLATYREAFLGHVIPVFNPECLSSWLIHYLCTKEKLT